MALHTTLPLSYSAPVLARTNISPTTIDEDRIMWTKTKSRAMVDHGILQVLRRYSTVFLPLHLNAAAVNIPRAVRRVQAGWTFFGLGLR